MIIDELFDLQRIYRDFLHEWEIIKDSIFKSIKTNELPSYKLLESKDEDHEVRFFFCGIPCYVRLKYDLKRGGAEYGVLVPGPLEGYSQRKAIHQLDFVEFDQDSRRLYKGNALIMHEKTLARIFPQMLAAFFEDSSKSS